MCTKAPASWLLFAAAALLPWAASSAQYERGRVAVRVPDLFPHITRIGLRGDSAFFWQVSAPDSSAYAFDRRRRAFARVAMPIGIPAPTDFGPGLQRIQGGPLVDSLELGSVRISDDRSSTALRVAGKRTIGLRGVRVTAEQRWRRVHGEPRMDPGSDEYPGPEPTDWQPISVTAIAIDSFAVWLGTESERVVYRERALGGLLRVDRRTLAVTVVEDSLLMHSSVSQITGDGKGGYLVLANGDIVRLDTATRKARRLEVKLPGIEQFAVASDTLFVAGGAMIGVVDPGRRSLVSRGFKLDMAGDSAIFSIADSAITPSWRFLAALGLADQFHIAPLGAWMRAAAGRVKPVEVEYYFPGDRQSIRITVDSTGEKPDSSDYLAERLDGPTAFHVDSIAHPALRPFLRRALRSRDMYSNVTLARLLLDAADTAAVPDLRIALDSTEYPLSARIASVLARLGDSTGHRWIRRALADTMRPSASLDSAARIHHFVLDAAGEVKDPANIPRLLELAADHRYAWGAAEALLAYRSADVLGRAMAITSRSPDEVGLQNILGAIAVDSTTLVETPAVRDAARAIARRLLLGLQPGRATLGAAVVVRFANVDDLPYLIGALTRDSSSYGGAVVALVRLAGTGADAMPMGVGTAATRAEAQRWWTAWYGRSRNTFRPASAAAADREVNRMYEKLRGPG